MPLHKRQRLALSLVLGTITLAGCGGEAPEHQSAALAGDNLTAAPPVAAPPTPKREQYSRDQLREQARTDPEGADATAIDQMSRQELIATSINSAGFLCARVTDFYLRGEDIIAHCIEYRSGTGRVSYRIDPARSSVEQIY